MRTKCIIVDDNPKILDLLTSYVGKTQFLRLHATYTSILSLMQEMDKLEPDVIFVNTKMSGVDSITFAHSIRKDCKVILVTDEDKYDAKRYGFPVFDYLLTPISYQEFYNVTERANLDQDIYYNKINPLGRVKHSTMWIKSESKYVQIELSNVTFIEGVKDYVNFHFANTNRPVIALMRMKKIEKLLPEEFVRIHKSYLVNMDHINYVERGYVIVNGERLPMGLNFKEEFMSHIKVTSAV